MLRGRRIANRLLLVQSHGDVHVTLIGELHTVADEVEQHLADATDVADQAARHVVGDFSASSMFFSVARAVSRSRTSSTAWSRS